MPRPLATGPAVLVLLTLTVAAHADKVDDYIQAQMLKRHVVGLSLAIIDHGKIIKARGYGRVDRNAGARVTTDTLFQAGSISKSVAALGALHLVQQGKLALDADVNTELTSWKVPQNEFTKQKPVTLRGILSHSAGLTVHGFPGYAVDEARPTLVQVLDGEPPANTPAIRVDILPGSEWRYSGGGYTIMQQMVLDVTGELFPQFMQETVLAPLGMTHSSYEQPLPPDRAQETASGYYTNLQAVQGRWHVYPEMAAAGLWTTASDLAHFAVGVQQSLAGTSNPVISQEMTRQMLTNQKDNDGLGVFLESTGDNTRFTHNGRDEGFDAVVMATAKTGQGAAIMINANENSGMAGRILQVIAEEYHWGDYPVLPAVPDQPVQVARKTLDSCTGYYNMPGGALLTVRAEKGHLVLSVEGSLLDDFLPTSEMTFFSRDLGLHLKLSRETNGAVSGLVWHAGERDTTVGRIGPLFSALKPGPDPDPEVTRRIREVVDQCKQGGRQVAESPYLTPGARHDFTRPVAEFVSVESLTFVAAQDVADRKIERHGGKVSRIFYYRLRSGTSARNLLVYLTEQGLVTDYDFGDA